MAKMTMHPHKFGRLMAYKSKQAQNAKLEQFASSKAFQAPPIISQRKVTKK